jgi:histidinol-phosphate aminotransferase
VDFCGCSSLPLVREYENLIVTRSFSKSYSLAGLRVGAAAASPDIIRGFIKLKDSYNVDRLAEAGARAALLDQKSFKYNVEMVNNNKEFLEERLKEMGFAIVPSQANFLFVKHPKIAAEMIYKKLLERKILIRYFAGPVQGDYVRISIGTMMELRTLVKELAAITAAL